MLGSIRQLKQQINNIVLQLHEQKQTKEQAQKQNLAQKIPDPFKLFFGASLSIFSAVWLTRHLPRILKFISVTYLQTNAMKMLRRFIQRQS